MREAAVWNQLPSHSRDTGQASRGKALTVISTRVTPHEDKGLLHPTEMFYIWSGSADHSWPRVNGVTEWKL